MTNWYLVKADYSQIELRMAAVVTKDPVMLETFIKDLDIHTMTAALVNGIPMEAVTEDLRYKAKAVNFGLAFDQSAAGFQEYAKSQYGLDLTLQECKEFKTNFLDTYEGIKRYHYQIKNDTRSAMFHKKVYKEVGLTGRVRYWRPGDIPLILKENCRGDQEEHYYTVCKDVINFRIQNGNAESMKRAEIVVSRAVKKENLRSKSILQVHDEKVAEVHKDDVKRFCQILAGGMKHAANLVVKNKVPIKVEVSVGKDWGNMKKVLSV